MNTKDQEKHTLTAYIFWAIFALLGWIFGIMLSVDNVWIQIGLLLVIFVLGVISAGFLMNLIFAGKTDLNLLGCNTGLFISSGICVITIGSIFPLSGPLSILLNILSIVLIVTGIVLYIIAFVSFGMPRDLLIHVPQLVGEPVMEPESISFRFRLRASYKFFMFAEWKPLGVVPLAIWPWLVWILPRIGISVHPLLAAVVVFGILLMPLLLMKMFDPRPAYSVRGYIRLKGKIDFSDLNREEKIMQHNNNLSLADFYAALQPKFFDNYIYDELLSNVAWGGLCDVLTALGRITDAKNFFCSESRFDDVNESNLEAYFDVIDRFST